MRLIPDRLGPRLNLSLLLFMVLLGAAMAGLVLLGFRRTQGGATDRSREALEAQARDSLRSNAGVEAYVGDSQIGATGALGVAAAKALLDLRSAGASVAADPGRLVDSGDGMRYDADPKRTTDVVVQRGFALDDAALRDIRESAVLDGVFPGLMAGSENPARERNFDAVAMYFDSVNGVTRYYPPTRTGQRAPIMETLQAEMARVGPQGNPDRKTVWTAPYLDPAGQGPVVTASTPVYDGSEFRGVMNVDLSLERLIAQVDVMKPTASGYAFYLDRDGKLLHTASYDVVRDGMADSTNEPFAATIAAMRHGQSGVDRVTLGGRSVYVAYAPLPAVGGSFALVAPIDEITAQAGQVSASIRHEGNRMLGVTLGTMALFFILAVAATAWLNRRLILQPIASLVAGTRAVAAGDLGVRVPPVSTDELAMLAESFNGMTEQLSFRDQALREQEQQYRSVFESTTDGLVIVDIDGKVVEANPAMCAMHGYTRAEFLALPPLGYLDPAYMARRHDYAQRVRERGEARARSRDRRRDGSTFPVDVYGTLFSYRGKPHILSVVRDITEQEEAERLLERRVEDRTRELRALVDVSRDVASTLDLQRLHAMVLRHVKSAVGYDRAVFMLLEGNELVVVAADSGDTDEMRELPGMRFDVGPGGPFQGMWSVMARGRPMLIDDVRDDSPVSAGFRAAIGPRIDTTMRFVRGWLGAPLRLQDRPIGMLALSTSEPGVYTTAHAELAAAIGGQVAFAVENARLFERVESRTRELQALLDISHSVAAKLELGPLIALVLAQLRSVVDYNGASVLMLEGDQLVLQDFRLAGDGERRQPLGFPVARSGGLWEPMLRKEAVIVADVRADDDFARGFRETVGPVLDTQYAHVRAFLAVPLALQERVIGLLAISHGTPGFFTPEHARLAAAVANHAAISIENARLFEQAEARTRELKTVLDVSRTVASTLDLRALVSLMLDQLQDVVQYSGASILTIEGTDAIMLESRGPARSETETVGMRFALPQLANWWQRLAAGEPIRIDNVRDPEDPQAAVYRDAIGPMLETPAFDYIRSWLGVPLVLKDRVVGVLTMSRDTAGYFDDGHARIALAIGQQAAIAIENARLFEQAEARTRELQALLEVSHTVAGTLELSTLFDLVLEQLHVVADYSGASILTLDGDELVIRGSAGLGRDAAGARFPLPSAGAVWEAMKRREPVLIRDMRGDEPYAIAYRAAVGPLFQTTFSYVRSWLAVPVALQDRVIGMMTMSRDEPDFFSERHVRLASAIADQAAVAIENARLYERTQIAAAIEERQRLARELHDSVSQALYGIALGARTARTLLDRDPAKALEPVDYVLSLAEAGLAEMRALIFELRPESLATEGLVAAIEKQVAATRARYGVLVHAELGDEPDAPLETKEALYRIAQESMHNTVKHARATALRLRLDRHDGVIRLEVADDGIGFDPAGDFPGHLGLKSMRERVERLRGRLRVESATGEGTTIVAEIPVAPAPAPAS
ncbi:MAG TPA: GAF domain-containing protein [Dehalococcoidia bacterium]|nr:GAF domain-containing protein [Dehalococcoidia bacterium]